MNSIMLLSTQTLRIKLFKGNNKSDKLKFINISFVGHHAYFN